MRPVRHAATLAALAVVTGLAACGGGTGGGAPAELPPGLLAPAGFAAAGGHGSVALSWAAVAGATGYEVARTSGPAFDPMAAQTLETAATAWADYGFDGGETWTFAVRARRSAEAGPWSPPRTVVTLSALASLALVPATLVLEPGASATVALVATYADATSEDVTAGAAWAVDGLATLAPGSPAVISAPAGAFGATLVHATYQGAVLPLRVGVRRPGDHVAFVTSTWGRTDLGAWSDAGGATGLAAADAICQAAAGRAGIPGTFAAWLSTPADDAGCRVAGFAGQRAASCGQGALPDAGPWVRADGTPFAPRLSALAAAPGVLLSAPQVTEAGADLDGVTTYFSSSGPDGVYLTSTDCAGFAGAPLELAWTGDPLDGDLTPQASAYLCPTIDARLLCLQTGLGPALPPYQTAGRRIFVSAATGLGKLSAWPGAAGAAGAAAGDSLCRGWAAAAGLANPTAFKALLSETHAPASARITAEGPYVRADGVVVARTRAALLEHRVLSPVALDEHGSPAPPDRRAFTGLWTAGGASPNGTCVDWTSDGPVGGQAWSAWDGVGFRGWTILCSSAASLVCVED